MENCSKNKIQSNVLNYPPQKLELKTILFLVISQWKPQAFFLPLNTFKPHSKLGLWVWKSFFVNLLYMNAYRSLWMVNDVGGAVSMVTFQCTLFLALQLDLHSWGAVNEKVRTQSHLEGRRCERRSLSRCRYILNPPSCTVLAWPRLFMVPQPHCGKRCLQHPWQRANFLNNQREFTS